MTDEAQASRDTFGHHIDVPLSEAEIKARLERNMEVDQKMIDLKAEKTAANVQWNQELSDLRKEQAALITATKTGMTKIEIQCYHERDDRRGMMRTLRCDTGEMVDERALTAEERNEDRQGKLFESNGRPPEDLAVPDEEEESEGDTDAQAALDEYAAERAKVAASGSGPSDDDGAADADEFDDSEDE